MGAYIGRFSATRGADTLNDTSDTVATMVADRHRAMTPTERCQAASSMFETARAIVDSSLPPGLTLEQRRLAAIRRLYRGELPEAAFVAHAGYWLTKR
jgi:hypothetical protein